LTTVQSHFKASTEERKINEYRRFKKTWIKRKRKYTQNILIKTE
jgi:hypothetical protein